VGYEVGCQKFQEAIFPRKSSGENWMEFIAYTVSGKSTGRGALILFSIRGRTIMAHKVKPDELMMLLEIAIRSGMKIRCQDIPQLSLDEIVELLDCFLLLVLHRIDSPRNTLAA